MYFEGDKLYFDGSTSSWGLCDGQISYYVQSVRKGPDVVRILFVNCVPWGQVVRSPGTELIMCHLFF